MRKVFVAYPWRVYKNRERYKRAYTALGEKFDIKFLFAEDRLSAKHVLGKIASLIQEADFGIYDVTAWNANVTLEYGLALALGKPAFIAFNPEKTELEEVPTDVRGFDRLQYVDFDDLKERLESFLASEPDLTPMFADLKVPRNNALNVGVAVRRAQIPALDRSDQGRDTWTAAEIGRLLAPVLSPDPPPDSQNRSIDEFRGQVRDYLKRAVPHLADELNARAVQNGLGLLQLTIENRTDHNFSAAVLDLELPDGIRAFFSKEQAEGHSRFPSSPVEWGGGDNLARMLTRYPMQRPPSPDDALIDNYSGCRVEYPPVHLRPRGTKPTRPLYLLADDSLASSVISASWKISARNTSGVQTGHIELAVDDGVVRPIDLVPSGK